jgi:hypothetical protein
MELIEPDGGDVSGVLNQFVLDGYRFDGVPGNLGFLSEVVFGRGKTRIMLSPKP